MTSVNQNLAVNALNGSQATKYVSQSGDASIDTFFEGTPKVWAPNNGNGPTQISFSFYNGNSATLNEGAYGSGFAGQIANEPTVQFTDAQKAAIRAALTEWEKVANVEFVEVQEVNGDAGTMRFFGTNESYNGYAAYGFYPSSTSAGGDIWLMEDYMTADSWEQGETWQFRTLMHEIGHSMGLGHAGEGGSADFPTYRTYSIMAKSDYASSWAVVDGEFRYTVSNTPMVYDIQAMQYLYGANESYNAGDTTYKFEQDDAQVTAIWDAGGEDTFDFTDFTADNIIDMRAGKYSTIAFDGVREGTVNIGNAFGVTIENLDSGAGNDKITGNDAANEINAGAGRDVVNGLDGNDVIYGGAGNDKLRGQDGNDVLNGGEGKDKLYGGAGSDQLFGDATDLLVGNGGADRFIFTGAEGRIKIKDFDAGQGDVIIAAASNGESAGDIQSQAYESGKNTILEFDDFTIVLKNTQLDDLEDHSGWLF
ncbi:M10 family metallopeptidase C-terminal domain-containing protein [Marivivens aquimaris]|uniref:M10 family metallopeptidase C-terminal domain-containing protein n=1 Tax=Marivivens aquimaris TaxID=2774876 RepID=UPI002AD2116E|nr:M10 family metallopeptidase C-terminal domain-containing protein [Marivivens aquimaris]